MCPCGLEIQPYPELLPKKCCQQGEGGDSAPQLCAVRPHVLHPDVESSVQDRHGPVKAFPEEDHKIDPRDGRLQRHLRLAFHYLKGNYEKGGDRVFGKICCDRTRENDLKLKEGRLRSVIKKLFFFFLQ